MDAPKGTARRGAWLGRLGRPWVTATLALALLLWAWAATSQNPRGWASNVWSSAIRGMGGGARVSPPADLEAVLVAKVGGEVRVVSTTRESWDAWGPLVEGGAERFAIFSPRSLEAEPGAWGRVRRGWRGVGSVMWAGATRAQVARAAELLREHWAGVESLEGFASVEDGVRVDWVGVGINAGTVGTLVLALASLGWVPGAWRRLWRREGGCAGCGYDLRLAGGGRLARCPECGRISVGT